MAMTDQIVGVSVAQEAQPYAGIRAVGSAVRAFARYEACSNAIDSIDDLHAGVGGEADFLPTERLRRAALGLRYAEAGARLALLVPEAGAILYSCASGDYTLAVPGILLAESVKGIAVAVRAGVLHALLRRGATLLELADEA